MGNQVSLFVTCMVDQLFPKVGIAMADVLERLGYRVDFPEAQTCCGQPAFNSAMPAIRPGMQADVRFKLE